MVATAVSISARSMLALGLLLSLGTTAHKLDKPDVADLGPNEFDSDSEVCESEEGALSLRQLRAQRRLGLASSTLAASAEEPAAQDSSALEPLSWDEAYKSAKVLLWLMEHEEKASLLRGIGWTRVGTSNELQKWWYVGNTGGIPRLHVPSLNMQDAGSGFRTYWPELVGTATCWPSQLALAATWNPEAVRDYAVALGREFAGKGANGVLGPSINVHRVARGGRNFEYLSGEDPYLGSRLVTAYVQGVQSQGILAVMKHWVFNNQETNRNTQNSIVDEQTAFEIYYPPFQAAVDAGVSAAMCSYNRIDGVYSCSNDGQLNTILKGRMGFRGFVQSDWWAVHDNHSVAAGLDQDMPGWPVESYFLNDFPSTYQLATASPDSVDDAVVRILAAMMRLHLEKSTKCAPPYCKEWFERNVTGPGHRALARRLARESIVLLKNEGGLLPLRPKAQNIASIAVIGPAAAASAFDPAGAGQGVANAWRIGDYYSGGGSGHVVADHLVTALEGIRARAQQEGVRVVAVPSNDTEEAVAAAAACDVALVVAGAWSGEGADRPDLKLDDGADELIGAVAASAKKTVVLLQIPGAVLTPWRSDVAAILALFLGGQETGSAWADVLFGDHAPTGRLPLMMPASEADTVPPSTLMNITYDEGMALSYRNSSFKAAFPFGHGLTYSSFDYLNARTVECAGRKPPALLCIRTRLRNTGSVAARTIAQLYLEFPPEAQHPAPFLKGFESTGSVLPGDTALVTFALVERDLSYFDADSSSWVLADSAVAHIGESSADVRLSIQLAVPEAAAEHTS